MKIINYRGKVLFSSELFLHFFERAFFCPGQGTFTLSLLQQERKSTLVLVKEVVSSKHRRFDPDMEKLLC